MPTSLPPIVVCEAFTGRVEWQRVRRHHTASGDFVHQCTRPTNAWPRRSSAASTTNLAAVRRQWVNMRAATAGLVDGYSCVPLPVSTLTAVSCTWVARLCWTLTTFSIATATIVIIAIAVSVACVVEVSGSRGDAACLHVARRMYTCTRNAHPFCPHVLRV